MEQSIPVIWSEVMQEWVLIDVMPGSFSPLRPSAVFTLPIELSSSPSSSSLITSAQPQLPTDISGSNFEVLTGQSSTVDSSVYQELTSAEFVASDNQAFVVQGSVEQEGANGGDDGNSGEELQYLVLGRMQHVPVPDQALNLSSSDVVDPNCWGDSCPCKTYESQVLYSVKCNGCFRSIGPSELVMRVAGGAIYHTDCFTCGRCGRHLTKGDEFALRRGGLLCRRDLDACLLDVSLSGGNSVGGNGVSIAGAVEPNSPDGCAAGENSGNGNGRGPISPNGSGGDLGTLMGDTGPTVEHCGQPETGGNYSPRTSCEIVLGVANIKSEIANTNSSSSPYSPSNSNNGGGGQQGSQQSQSVQPPLNVKPDGRRGPKRPRTILTTAQRRAFKASFEISQKPCRKVRETLAKETGLSVRIVQVWFQNQRAKLKKIQRKQQQAALVHGGGGGNGGGNGGNGSHGGGGNGNGFLNGSESGTGMGSAHSSDKSKDDSTDDEDDDCSSQANTAFGSVSGGGGGTGGNMQSMAGYGMLQSPDGSYYSTGREDDSTGGGGGGGGGNGGNYMMTSGAKSDLGALDDSETSLCELDDGNGILVRPNSTGVPPLHGGGNFGPGATSMMSPLELTCLTGGGVGQPSMFSPNITGNMIMPFGGGGVGGLPLPPQQLGPNHLLTTSSSVSESSLTPIDKLYSMQNSYFSSSSNGGGGGNPQEQECL